MMVEIHYSGDHEFWNDRWFQNPNRLVVSESGLIEGLTPQKKWTESRINWLTSESWINRGIILEWRGQIKHRLTDSESSTDLYIQNVCLILACWSDKNFIIRNQNSELVTIIRILKRDLWNPQRTIRVSLIDCKDSEFVFWTLIVFPRFWNIRILENSETYW